MPSSAGTFLFINSLINVLVEKLFILSFASTRNSFKADITFSWAAKGMIWVLNELRLHCKGSCTLADFWLADKNSSLVRESAVDSDKSATRSGLVR